jgi:hypothetical protein
MKLKKSVIIDVLIILLTIGIFIWLKLDGLTWHFGDGNAYFYMAQQVLGGHLPYRDFLLADPPFLIFLLAAVKLLIGQQIILFQWVPVLLEIAASGVLYLIIKPKLPKLAKFIPAIYLFSFLILSTSDYLTGLHFINLFISLAYFFRKKPVVSGVFWGLATLIKLYVIPGFLGWMIWLILSKKTKQAKKTAIAYATTGTLFMLPFLIMAPQSVVKQIIIHQFNRPKGLNRLTIFSFFLQHDFILISLASFSWWLTKNKKYLLPFVSWLFFYLMFKDLYYLYLGVLAPWLILSLTDLWAYFKTQTKQALLEQHSDQIIIMLMITIFMFQILGIHFYKNSIQAEGVFEQLPAVAEYVKSLPAKPLYGSHEVAPLVALASNRQLFGNYIDTNSQLFGSGVLNKEQISQQAAQEGIYFLSKVADIPENSDVDQGYSGYFDPQVFNQACERLKIFHGNDAELFDDVAVYECSLE